MIDIRPIFHVSFWFDLQPMTLSPFFEQGFFLLFAALVIGGSAGRIVARNRFEDRLMIRLYFKVANMLMYMGFLGFLWLFFSFEEAYFLGARFWMIVWAVGFAFWAFSLFKEAKITIPAKKESMLAREEAKKYIPRRRKK